ncbi:hypothetical protein Tco_0929689 [Tanacetum coccineum]
MKKSRGKWSQGKNSVDTPKPASVDVSDESDFEPARKRTGSRRVIKKKVSISAEDNMIPEPDVTLELGKSISLIEAAAEEAARQVHATHERIVTESNPETARIRPSGIAFRDTSSVSKKMSPDPSQKLKGVQTLTPKEQLAADMMGSQLDDEETDDELIHGDERVHDDADGEMTDAKDTETREDDEGITYAEKTEVTKGDLEHAGKPLLISSNLSVLPVIPEPLVFLPIPEIPLVAPATTLLPPPHYVSTISPVLQQTTTPIPTPPITTEALPVIMIPDPLPAITQRVFVLEKDVQELKEFDHTTTLFASLKSEIPSNQVGYKEVIEESVQANVINKVKNLLPKFLPKVVSDFAIPPTQSTLKKSLEKTPLVLA